MQNTTTVFKQVFKKRKLLFNIFSIFVRSFTCKLHNTKQDLIQGFVYFV